MFDVVTLAKYFSIICYVGFFISSITGFIAISKDFNLCEFMISLIVLTNVPIITFFELINKNKHSVQLLHYGRSYLMLILSLLVMGLSHVGLGFSMYGIILFIVNLLLGVFNCTSENENTSPESIEKH